MSTPDVKRNHQVSLARIRRGINQRGQALVEFMLVIPLILLLVSGVADLGRAFYFKIAAENTAREAAHWAILTDPNGSAFDDNAILQKVQTPSQESFGIGITLAPQCTSIDGITNGTYTDGAPVGTCSAGTQLLRYATPTVPTSMAHPVLGPHAGPNLPNGQAWMFIYPGASGRTAMVPTPSNVAWAVTNVRSYTIAANAPTSGGIDWARAVAGGLIPADADAANGTTDCYGFGAPAALTTWNASLSPADASSLSHTESPTVTVNKTNKPPANDLFLTVSGSSPSLSGSLTQSWTPAGANSTSAFISLTNGQTSATVTGTLSLSGSNPPPPGTYTVTVTASTQNKPTDLTVTCTQIDQTNTFQLKVFGDPCKTGYTNPSGNPFSTSCTRPVVTSVSPSTGSFMGGYNVTIGGSGFSSNGNANCTAVDTVQFGAVAGTVVSCNDSTMVATVPAAAPSSVDVTVTNPNNGTSVVNRPADTFTYQCAVGAKPCVTTVSPRNGPKAGGTSVTITGTNFFNGGLACAVTGVQFGGLPAVTPSSCSDTTLVVTSPASPTASTVDVVVTTPGGSSGASATDAFTFLADPGPPPPPASNGPKVHQITITVIYAFVPITPGIGLFNGPTVLYIVGEATLKATY